MFEKDPANRGEVDLAAGIMRNMLFGKGDSDCEGDEVHTRQLDMQFAVTAAVCERSLESEPVP